MRKIYLFLLTLLCAVGASAQTDATITPSSWTLVDASDYPQGLIWSESLSDGSTTDHTGHSVYKSEEKLTTTGTTVTLTFTWIGGAHALQPMGVEILTADESLVSSDYHIGKAGGSVFKNVYTLNNVTAGTEYTVRIYACNLANDHQITNHHGNVALTGATFSGITPPTSGKFYRIKNYSGNGYLISGTAADVAKFGPTSTASTQTNSVFYLDGSKLVSFTTGLYLVLNNNKLSYTTSVGSTSAVELGFEKIFGTQNMYSISIASGRYMYCASASNEIATDSGEEKAKKNTTNSFFYTFAVEEVTWLPVPMNTTAGYATLYSPVQLGLGDGSDRVEVYTVSSAAGTTATLSRKTCVPANTGVILKYVKDVTNGCVYLPVQATTETSVTSLLEGSLADELVSDDAYVLSMPADRSVGLYRAEKNQAGNTWLNQGFHAYLPATQITGIGGARVLTFNFDDNAETGINAVEIEEAAPANAAIYDLSGRRVQSAKSGLYIINGKKVIK